MIVACNVGGASPDGYTILMPIDMNGGTWML
jgi:hypothetical protein